MSQSLYPDNPLDSVKGDEFDLDSVDGFRSYLRKVFSPYSCTSSKGEKSADENSPGHNLKDFTENKNVKKQAIPPFDWDDNAYSFSHPKRGLAIIINNEDFSQSKDFGDRPGSSYDASSLYHSFRFLGFDVMPYDNLPAWKIVEVLKIAATQYNHKDADCFACAILTHGDRIMTQKEWDRLGQDVNLDLLFGSDGREIATRVVVEIFNDFNCPTLIDKPRLFFLQACRGDKYDDGQIVLVKKKSEQTITMHHRMGDQRDATDATDGKDDSNSNNKNPPKPVERQESFSSSVDPAKYHTRDATDALGGDAVKKDDISDDVWKKRDPGSEGSAQGSDKTDALWNPIKDIPVSPAPLYKDCLVMYATPPGHFAWRRRTGAWFIQSLCKIIDTGILESVPLMRVLARVCGKTAKEYQSENPNNPEMHGKKEVPVIESMLVKDIFIPRRIRAVRR